jgi:hypothetical protein
MSNESHSDLGIGKYANLIPDDLRLFSAAPDLLSACKRALRDRFCWDDPVCDKDTITNQLRAAIEKAGYDPYSTEPAKPSTYPVISRMIDDLEKQAEVLRMRHLETLETVRLLKAEAARRYQGIGDVYGPGDRVPSKFEVPK